MKNSVYRSVISFILALILAFSAVGIVAIAADVTVVKQPSRTSFYQGVDWSYNKAGKLVTIGGDLDVSGTVLSYNSKTAEYTIDKFPNMYTKPDSGQWKAGKNIARIYCDNFGSKVYATTEINLVEVDSISIITPPTKTVLHQDKDWVLSGLNDVEFTELDLTGLKIRVLYKDGTTKQIAYSDNQLIGWAVPQNIDSFEPGPCTIYATFGGKRAPFGVTFLVKGGSLLGDVNNDYNVNSADALMILQHVVGKITLTSEQIARADVNKVDGANSTDALTILQYVVGKITSF